jgi:hypothetical protein
MDLKASVEMQNGQVRIRPSGPADSGASVLHLVFTVITRPMIEENAVQLAVEDKDDVSLDELGDSLDKMSKVPLLLTSCHQPFSSSSPVT